MKAIFFIFLLLASGICAEEANLEIVTTDGKKYSGVTIRKIEPDGLSILHSSGVAKVPFEKLPEDIRVKYGYDEADAAEHRAKLAEAEKRMAEAQQAAREKQREESREEEVKEVDKEFAAKLTKAAKMMKVNAHQNDRIGLIGDITEGTLSSEPVRNTLGSIVSRKPKWIYKTQPVAGVIAGAKGAVVVETALGNEIHWEGKAWRIGLIQYMTGQGLLRTCPLYTASEKEASAFYRRNGFSPKSDGIAKRAR